MAKLSVSAFAQRVKTKYPEYSSLDDNELARRIVAKHPEYADQVDLDATSTPDVRSAIADRAANPSRERYGDPTAPLQGASNDLSWKDASIAAGKGFARGVGFPIDEALGAPPPPKFQQLKEAAITGLLGAAAPLYGIARATPEVTSRIAAPAWAVIRDNRPATKQERTEQLEASAQAIPTIAMAKGLAEQGGMIRKAARTPVAHGQTIATRATKPLEPEVLPPIDKRAVVLDDDLASAVQSNEIDPYSAEVAQRRRAEQPRSQPRRFLANEPVEPVQEPLRPAPEVVEADAITAPRRVKEPAPRPLKDVWSEYQRVKAESDATGVAEETRGTHEGPNGEIWPDVIRISRADAQNEHLMQQATTEAEHIGARVEVMPESWQNAADARATATRQARYDRLAALETELREAAAREAGVNPETQPIASGGGYRPKLVEAKPQERPASRPAAGGMKVYRGSGDIGKGTMPNDARLGPGTYYTDNKEVAKIFARERGGSVEETNINPRKVFDAWEPDTATPEFTTLRQRLISEGLSPDFVDHAITDGRPDAFTSIAKELGRDEKGGAWRGAGKMNQILRDSGYDAIKARTRDAADLPNHDEIVLLGEESATRVTPAGIDNSWIDDLPEVEGIKGGTAAPLTPADEAWQFLGEERKKAAPPEEPPASGGGIGPNGGDPDFTGSGTEGPRSPKEPPLREVPETAWGHIKDRYLTQGLEALRSHGATATELADKLETTQRRYLRLAAEPINALKAVDKLSPLEKEQFIDVLDGKTQDAPPNVKALANLHRQFLNQFGTMAEQSGIMIRLPNGDYAPFKMREGYFPHLGLGDDKAPIFATADEIAPGKRVGSLEHSRTGEGEFNRDPAHVLTEYYLGAARKLAEVEQFGPDIESAVNEYAKRATKEGAPTKFISDAMKQSLGGGPRPSQAVSNIASDAMNLQVVEKLATAVIGNSTQTAFTVAKAGYGNTAKALYDVVRGTTKNPEILREAILSGATLETLSQELLSGKNSRILAKIAKGTMKYTGFTGVEHFNRLLAAQAGIRTAEELAGVATGQKGAAWFTPKVGPNKRANAALAELQKMGVDTHKLMSTGGLSSEDKINAAEYMSHKTQFGTRPEDMPYGWTASPTARVLFQFKGFSFKAAKFMKDDIVKPALHGDVMPLARFLVAAGVAGGITDTARKALMGKPMGVEGTSALARRLTAKLDGKSRDAAAAFVDGAISVGMSNIVANIYRAGQYGGLVDFLAGPTVGDAMNHIDTMQTIARTGKVQKPLAKDIKKTVPVSRAVTNRLGQ